MKAHRRIALAVASGSLLLGIVLARNGWNETPTEDPATRTSNHPFQATTIAPLNTASHIAPPAVESTLARTSRTTPMSANDYVARIRSLVGSVVVLEYWATWCEHCEEQFFILDKIAAEYSDKHVTVLTVSHDDEQDTVDRFLSRNPTHAEALWELLGPNGTRAAALSTLGVTQKTKIPETFIFDRRGREAVHWTGMHKASELRVNLDRLLSEPAE